MNKHAPAVHREKQVVDMSTMVDVVNVVPQRLQHRASSVACLQRYMVNMVFMFTCKHRLSMLTCISVNMVSDV